MFAEPVAFLEIELAEFGDVFGAEEEAPAAGGDVLGTGGPFGVFDAEGGEETWFEVVEERLAGEAGDDGGAEVGGGGIVEEVGAGGVGDGLGEEGVGPGDVGGEFWLGSVAGGHG